MNDVTSQPASERRQFLRVVPDAMEPVRVDITGTNFFDICKAYDIGEGGVRILVPHRFEGCEIDRPVELMLHLPAPVNKAFKAQGMVRHIDADSFGVRFTTLDDKALALLRQYIASWVRRNEGLLDFFRYKLNRLR